MLSIYICFENLSQSSKTLVRGWREQWVASATFFLSPRTGCVSKGMAAQSLSWTSQLSVKQNQKLNSCSLQANVSKEVIIWGLLWNFSFCFFTLLRKLISKIAEGLSRSQEYLAGIHSRDAPHLKLKEEFVSSGVIQCKPGICQSCPCQRSRMSPLNNQMDKTSATFCPHWIETGMRN